MHQKQAPSALPPLASVLVVLRHSKAGVQVAALISSAYLDHGLPQFWSLPHACETNLLSAPSARGPWHSH